MSPKKNKEKVQKVNKKTLDKRNYFFFALLGVCLKTQFKFSARQIREVHEHIRSYINTLSQYKRYELKIEDIAASVAEECKFFDRRFVGGTNGE